MAGGDDVPNRILKESICSSDSIESLSWFEEVLFYRLIVNCDDYGRTDGRLAILKSRLFPLKSTTEKDIKAALNKLSEVGIVCIYSVDDKPFLQLVTWEQHQQVRSKKSKYPSPESGVILLTYDEFLKTYDIKCNQRNVNVPVIQSNPIQSESVSEYKSESDYKHGANKSCSEQEQVAVVSLILNDKSFYGVMQESIDHWKELYPAVDVLQELKKMQGWLEANPNKRKTKKGIMRFITNWLSKTQDKGGVSYGTSGGTIGQTNGKTPMFGNVL